MTSKNRWPTKLIAINFIILILAANIWLFDFFFGVRLPIWMGYLVSCNMACVFVGALALFWQWLKERFWDDQTL